MREIHILIFRGNESEPKEVRTVVGYAVDRFDVQTPWPMRWMPVPHIVGSEQVFVTTAIDQDLLERTTDREQLADFVAEQVSTAIRREIIEGPSA